MFSVCECYHNLRTVPLFKTVYKEAISRGHLVTFVGGFENHFDDIPIKKLADYDNYESAIEKNLNGIIYHSEQNIDFDFYMICDDDTFVNFDKLESLLERIDKDKLALYGHVSTINGDGVQHRYGDGRLHITGGPGILMNRKTFDVLAKAVKEHYIKHYINSDVSVALNIFKYNETAPENEQIEFCHIEDFHHHAFPLHSMADVATYHFRGKDGDDPDYIYKLNDMLS
jgi:hypothetical protein